MKVTKNELKDLIKEAINESLDEGIFDMFKKKKTPELAKSNASTKTGDSKETYTAYDVKKTLDTLVPREYGSFTRFKSRFGDSALEINKNKRAMVQQLQNKIAEVYPKDKYKYSFELSDDIAVDTAIEEWIRAQR